MRYASFILIIFSFQAVQFTCAQETRYISTLDWEIFLTIIDTDVEISVNVENLDDPTDEINNLGTFRHDTDSNGPEKGYDWVADSGPAGATGTYTDLDSNTRYKIEFNVYQINGEIPIDTKAYTYYACKVGHSYNSYGAFCLNSLTEADASDLHFIYENGSLGTWVDFLKPSNGNYPDLNSYWGNNYWAVPHSIDYDYCNNGVLSSCLAEIPEINFFLAPQIGTSYRIDDTEINISIHDWIIPSGQTWTFNNTDITFGAGYQLTVSGAFHANNSTFTASGTAWDGIYYSSGSSGVIDASIIEKTSGACVSTYYASPQIKNSTLKDCSGYGLYATSGYPTLYHSTIQNTSNHAVYLFDSDAYLGWNSISCTAGKAAVYATYYSVPLFASTAFGGNEGRNTLSGGTYGVYASNNATPHVGVSSSLAYNNRLVNNVYDAFAGSGASISATNAWWGETSPNMSQIVGSVNIANYLTSDPGPAFKYGGSAEESATLAVGNRLSEKLVAAIEYRYAQQFEKAVAILQDILAETTSFEERRHALLLLGHIQRLTQRADWLATLEHYASTDTGLEALASELVALSYLNAKDYASVLSRTTDQLARFTDTQRTQNAQVTQFLAHLNTGNEAAAIGMLEQLDQYEEIEALHWLAYLEGLLDKPPSRKTEDVFGKADIVVSSNGEVAVEAYPNPFNPTTTFRYAVSSKGFLSLRIYDMLGREVATLVNEVVEAGQYEAMFDASGLASGLYLYRVETLEHVQAGMVQLLK